MSPATDALPTATAPVSLPTPEPQADPTFEVGLVMAGAISAGAYTAGVVDFLFEALNNWYDPHLLAAEFAWQKPRPPHAVQLKTMAGASAGGMCAALTAISILRGNTALFRQAWVQDIDIRELLKPGDLDGIDGLDKLQSVLNCDILKTIANSAIALPAAPVWPAWLGSELNFYLTLTNLNGLVYEVTQQGGASQRFVDHADRIQYRLLKPGHPAPSLDPTKPADPLLDPSLRVLWATLPTGMTPEQAATLPAQRLAAWDELKTAALATGAFPVALLNRQLTFDDPYYDSRTWWYGGAAVWPPHVQRKGKPDLRRNPADPYPAPYLFVDGGMTNNEPLELVRRTLVGDITGKEPSNNNGLTARYASVMIDPFPSDANDFAYNQLKQELPQVITAIYTTLRNQARYRTEDLLGALDLDEHSRFLIAPIREAAPAATPGPAQPPVPSLASGTLGAFGGFLHQPFRAHDFQLGRRNCQRFLQQWFTLPANNPLFNNWPAALKKDPRFYTTQPATPATAERLPIIPLLGTARQPVPAPVWQAAQMPAVTLQDDVAPLIEARLDRLTRLLGTHVPGNWWWAAVGYRWFIQPKLRKKAQQIVMDTIGAALTTADLLSGSLASPRPWWRFW